MTLNYKGYEKQIKEFFSKENITQEKIDNYILTRKEAPPFTLPKEKQLTATDRFLMDWEANKSEMKKKRIQNEEKSEEELLAECDDSCAGYDEARDNESSLG